MANDDLRRIGSESLSLAVQLIADTVALLILLLGFAVISWILSHFFLADRRLQQILKLTHEAGSAVLFALFLYLQIKRFWERGKGRVYELVAA